MYARNAERNQQRHDFARIYACIHDNRHSLVKRPANGENIYKNRLLKNSLALFRFNLFFHSPSIPYTEEAAEIVIIGDTEVDLTQGMPFDIEVEIKTADGRLVLSEQGRELQISAGFRYYTPSENSQLFDLIEEMEETPTKTP